ncbi:TPA: DUF262 domain-containing protein [Streptococcus suis]|nr:DUF262 domain-containing protein [Streptococcus suis]
MILIESSQKTVEELLTSFSDDKTLEVPLYQREYSWKEKNWEEFYTDFVRAYERKNSTDYWGNILIYDNGSNYEVVDGQQRIITLIIFIHSLGKKLNKSGKIPLKFNNSGSNRVWETLFDVDENGNPKELHERRGNNFYRAFRFFQRKLNSKSNNMKTRYFNFLKQTQFSIVTSRDEVESYLLFGRLNTRGIRLTDIDLIKYEIFQKTERTMGVAGGDSVLDKWNEIHRQLEICKMDFTRYVTAWFEVKHNFNSENLYQNFCESIIDSDYIRILEALLDTANNISKLILDNTGSQNRIKRSLEYLIKISNSSKIYNVIISIVDTAFDSKIRLFEILSVYEFIRAITPPPDTPSSYIDGWTRSGISYTYEEIEEAYSEFSNTMASLAVNSVAEQIRTAILILKQKLKSKLPDRGDFIDFFSSLRYSSNSVYFERKNLEKIYSQYAIYTLNNWLEVGKPTQGERYRLYDDSEYSIEHIIEKSLGNEPEAYQFKIGNLVVLEKAINTKLSGESDLSKKISEYEGSSYQQVKELLHQNHRYFEKPYREQNDIEWDIYGFSEQDIYNRGRYLAMCFYKKAIELLN